VILIPVQIKYQRNILGIKINSTHVPCYGIHPGSTAEGIFTPGQEFHR
jgi:hypothetical protein